MSAAASSPQAQRPRKPLEKAEEIRKTSGLAARWSGPAIKVFFDFETPADYH
jgi:hypothetical protein